MANTQWGGGGFLVPSKPVVPQPTPEPISDDGGFPESEQIQEPAPDSEKEAL